MTTHEPTVTILILNWNGIEVLPRCLDALQALDYSQVAIVVADNGSTDGSVALIHEKYPSVKVIELGENMGFGRGYNAAFSQLEETTQLLVLLNNDVYVRPDWLRHLVKPFSDPQVGVTGAKLFFLDEIHIQHAGGQLDYPSGVAHHFAYKEVDRGQADQQREVPYVTGASMALRWSLATDMGLFDDQFWPYYYEEVDLCFRIRQAGYRIIYVPAAVAIHHETFSTQKNLAQTAYAFHRNRLRMVFRHYTDDQLLNDFIPSELARQQVQPMSAQELEAIRRVYLETMWELATGDDDSERTKVSLPALGNWWEASLRVDPEHVPGPIFGKPVLDPLFRTLQAGWNAFASKILFWPIVKRQRATNALLWRLVAELARHSSDREGAEYLSRELEALRKELRRIGQ